MVTVARPGVNGMVAWTTTTSDGRRSVSLSPPTIGGAHSPSSPLSNEMTLWTSSSEVSPREHDDKIINSSDHGRGSTKRRHEGSPPRFDDDDSSDGNTAVSVMVPQRPQAGHAASSLVDSYVTRTMTAVRVECASTTPPVVGVTSPAELFAIAIGMRNPTVLDLLARVLNSHVESIIAELKTTGSTTSLITRVTGALDHAGAAETWSPQVLRALRELHGAAAQQPSDDLAMDADRISRVIVSVARDVAQVKAATQHAAAVEASGCGVDHLRSVMARGVARRALENIVAAVSSAGAKASNSSQQVPPLAKAMEALAKAPEDVWEKFITAADGATARIPAGTPIAAAAKAVLQTREVRQTWLQVVTAVTAGEEERGSYQPATSFVHPYLCFVREFVRLRIGLTDRIRKM